VSSCPFGQVNGRDARLFSLENERMRVAVTDYAGALVSLELSDGGGSREHVVLGFDSAEQYAAVSGSFGALLGRNANRIAGGELTIEGRSYALSRNEHGSTLHGGVEGFGRRFWEVVEDHADHLSLALVSPDGDQGFPGEVRVTATYRLAQSSLTLAFEATTTRTTVLSLSNHPYFNLDGIASRDCLDHELTLHASRFLPTDERQIPTGELRSVAGTPFDFRSPRRMSERIRDTDVQLRYGGGYDHYFVLDGGDTDLAATGTGGEPSPRRAARVRSPRSGRVLELATTQPGLQFYTGNKLNGTVAGRGGFYRQSAGFALEPQGFPDSPHHPDFPSTLLAPGQVYRARTVYTFSHGAVDTRGVR